MHRMLFVVWIYHPLHDMPGICYIMKPQLLPKSVRDYDDSLGLSIDNGNCLLSV